MCATASGYYHYCGRTDDMFKVSGMWVSPFEVEAALASHEAVLEAAVIGKEDADGLIKPKAFIVLRNGYAADERLIETLRVHVKDMRRPVEISALDRRAARPAAHRDGEDSAIQIAGIGIVGRTSSRPRHATAASPPEIRSARRPPIQEPGESDEDHRHQKHDARRR